MDEIYAKCNVVVLEPATYDEVAKLHDWRVAMKEEISMIDKNGTWQLVEMPENGKVLGVKWVYKAKLNPNGSINKLKARLVVKGYFRQ